MLEIVGLDSTAQTVYELLIDNPPATFDEICTRVDIGDACLRKVLERLLCLGLVKSTASVPPKFTATAPDVALEVLLLEQQERIKRARLYVEQLAGRYVRTAAGREPAELVEVVSGQQAVAQLVEQIVRSTSHEIRFIDKHPYAVGPTVLAPVEAEMLRRGIIYRALYDTAGLATRSIQAEIEPAIALGEQARVIPQAPVKLILSDRRLALLPLQSNPTTIDSVVAVHPSAMLDALGALFEALWLSLIHIKRQRQAHRVADGGTSGSGGGSAARPVLPDVSAQIGCADRTPGRPDPVSGWAAGRVSRAGPRPVATRGPAGGPGTTRIGACRRGATPGTENTGRSAKLRGSGD